MLKLFERLGLAEALKAKTARRRPGRPTWSRPWPRGEAELGIFLINVLTAPGLDVVGPVPAELNQQVVFTAAVAADARQAEAARAFIAFLQTPAAQATIRAKGMIPG